MATGPLLAALVLLAAGLTWWFSDPQPKSDAPQEVAVTEAEPTPAPADSPTPSVAESAPAAEAPAEPRAPAKTFAEIAAQAVADAKEKLAALPSAGTLDAASCEAGLNATVTVEKIQFRSGRATIEAASGALLDRLAGLLKRCPDAKTEIGGYTDNVGSEAANQKLAQRRANAVADYLKKAGVHGDRLSSTGYGPANPVASNDTEDGRAANRRIEFKVK